MPQLVILCGLPGCGKTTLAKPLAKELGFALLEKDPIKEHLYDALDGKTIEDSRRLGLATISLLFELAERQLEAGANILLEGPFYYPEDIELFHRWADTYSHTITTVVCTIDEAERIRRVANRPRHHSHHDADRQIEDGYHPSLNADYTKMPGTILTVETARPTDEIAKELAANIKQP